MIVSLIVLAVIIILAGIVFKFILDISSTALKIIAHFIAGWILLTITNILPGINIPINLLTMAISGFGGVIGTALLAIFYLLF